MIHEDSTQTAALLAAIDERSRLFERAYGAGDAAGLVAGYFAADEYRPRACPPGGVPPVEGHAALVSMFTGMFAGAPAIALETLDVTASDSVAFELGRARLTLADGSTATGRFTVCWIATPQGWRAKIDFFAQDGWEDE